MTLIEFDNMDEKEQTETLLEHGVKIAERQEGKFLIVLYQMDSFYVESFFAKASMRKVGSRSFDDTEQLIPYLDKFDMNELI